MKEFLFIIRGGQEKYESNSPEEMQKHMEHWQQWMGSLAQAGKLTGGQPLMSEGKTLIEGGAKVMDRPLAEGKELIGGYLLIKEESLSHAAELAKNCPSLEYNCSIEVREISPME
ncbi:YciI family protein [Aquimarina sp. 2201CG5-10]|uniref:YciI family protein n=1 Tax=Aquimarina callyspongiae TaxID=3098150 RepID=UPI002AB4C112|nr:YciI family protein [Aquimarina sp. 2201CG5-10]MDY8137790.1 YciI family protein [Aquimarina sp. 2201CG5-10]